jgi:hypothetical protein
MVRLCLIAEEPKSKKGLLKCFHIGSTTDVGEDGKKYLAQESIFEERFRFDCEIATLI